MNKWHRRMERQYRKADQMNDVRAAVVAAKVALDTIAIWAKLGPISEIEERLQAMEERSIGHEQVG